MSASYEQNKKYAEKYRKKHIDRVVINLKIEDKAKWESVAEASGMPLATLLRKLMTDYISSKGL